MKLHITGHIPSPKLPVAGQQISWNWLAQRDNSRTILVCLIKSDEMRYTGELERHFFQVYYLNYNYHLFLQFHYLFFSIVRNELIVLNKL